MKTAFLDLKYLDESSQEQLNAYRNIGSVQHLRKLRQQEIRRHKISKAVLWVMEKLLLITLFALSIWVILSWIDTISHNTCTDPVYQAWNFFTLFF